MDDQIEVHPPHHDNYSMRVAIITSVISALIVALVSGAVYAYFSGRADRYLQSRVCRFVIGQGDFEYWRGLYPQALQTYESAAASSDCLGEDLRTAHAGVGDAYAALARFSAGSAQRNHELAIAAYEKATDGSDSRPEWGLQEIDRALKLARERAKLNNTETTKLELQALLDIKQRVNRLPDNARSDAVNRVILDIQPRVDAMRDAEQKALLAARDADADKKLQAALKQQASELEAGFAQAVRQLEAGFAQAVRQLEVSFVQQTQDVRIDLTQQSVHAQTAADQLRIENVMLRQGAQAVEAIVRKMQRQTDVATLKALVTTVSPPDAFEFQPNIDSSDTRTSPVIRLPRRTGPNWSLRHLPKEAPKRPQPAVFNGAWHESSGAAPCNQALIRSATRCVAQDGRVWSTQW